MGWTSVDVDAGAMWSLRVTATPGPYEDVIY